EYSRILAAQLNPGGSQQMQDFGTSHMPTDDPDGELAAHYQQLEDGEAEGYRAPMRTGYVDRLIPEGGPSDIDNRPHRTFQSDMERLWLMLQVASAHRGAEEASAREPMVLAAQEDSQPEVFTRFDALLRYAVPIAGLVCLAGLGGLMAIGS
ncbi:unnamed protein product, partial [Polarella glacialis]